MSEHDVPKPSLSIVATADENCEAAPVVNREPKGDGFGTTPPLVAQPSKHELPRRSYRKLLRLCSRFAMTLRRDKELAQVISTDLNGFRSDLERAMHVQFPLRRGRPTDPQLDAACRMVAEGRSISDVLRRQIQGWDKLDTYTRYLAAKGLRQALVRRKNVGREKL